MVRTHTIHSGCPMISSARRCSSLLPCLLAAAVTCGAALAEDTAVPAANNPPAVASEPAAPHAAQIEPMVAPVKRVAPVQQEIKVKPAAPAAGTAKAAKAKVVSDKPNCDSGFVLDSTGKQCVKAAKARSAKQR